MLAAVVKGSAGTGGRYDMARLIMEAINEASDRMFLDVQLLKASGGKGAAVRQSPAYVLWRSTHPSEST